MKNVVCLNSNTYHGFTFVDAVAGARAAGIHAIEIAAVRGYTEHADAAMSDAEVAAMRELLAQNEIDPIGMCGHTNILTPAGREVFLKNLDLAERLGVTYVVTSTGETHDDDTVIQDETELVSILRGLAGEAAHRGLQLTVETHGNNYGTGEKVAQLIAQVGAENLGITYDTANVIFYGGVHPYEDMRDSAAHITSIHLKDKAGEPTEWNFPAVGTGDIDFERVFAGLSETGCVAPLSIEIEFTPDGPGSLQAVHAALSTAADNTRLLLANQ